MIVCTYNIKDGLPKVKCEVKGKRKWHVELFIADGNERIAKTFRNIQKSYLPDLFPLVLEELRSMQDDLPKITDAGFIVKLLG